MLLCKLHSMDFREKLFTSLETQDPRLDSSGGELPWTRYPAIAAVSGSLRPLSFEPLPDALLSPALSLTLLRVVKALSMLLVLLLLLFKEKALLNLFHPGGHACEFVVAHVAQKDCPGQFTQHAFSLASQLMRVGGKPSCALMECLTL